MRKFNTRRYQSGMSMIELVVALVIIGIAIAGITEITFINGLWTMQSLNKIDNIYAAKLFFERIGYELRQARSFSTVANPNQALTFLTPIDGQVDPNGFPLSNYKSVSYKLVQDPSTTDPLYIIQVSYDGGVTWSTVLTDVVGPQPVGGGVPKVFQYVDQTVASNDPSYGVQDALTSSTGSVLINLELRKKQFGGTIASSTDSSIEGLRTEVFLRGRLGAD